MMNYSQASANCVNLQNALGDFTNTLVIPSKAEPRQFMICIRRVSFEISLLNKLLSFCRKNGMTIDIREADSENENERYMPIVGRFPKSNLIAVIY